MVKANEGYGYTAGISVAIIEGATPQFDRKLVTHKKISSCPLSAKKINPITTENRDTGTVSQSASDKDLNGMYALG